MPTRPHSILQVSTADALGGAERIALDLFREYRRAGQDSHLAVGRRRTQEPGILHIAHHRGANAWRRLWWGLHARVQRNFHRVPFAPHIARTLQHLAEPTGYLDTLRGIEDFHFPGTWHLLDLPPAPPDLLHCHNLHGKYFDLRALPWLSRQVPVILTLHDAWLLSGHCAHSFECAKWRTGCGHCPDLTIYPAIRRDATAGNWRRKQEIFRRCRLHVATPSQWLMDKVRQSMLAPAIVDSRVIPNAVDLDVFRPGDKAAARAELGLPQDADILLFAAYGVTRNSFKDFATLRAVAAQLGSRPRPRTLLVLALGEAGQPQRLGHAEIRFVPLVTDRRRVAQFHRAADLYVHAARADTFPTSIIEALACAAPVVATAVGGIAEQIGTFDVRSGPRPGDRATGILVPPMDAETMTAAVSHLLDSPGTRMALSRNAVAEAHSRFDLRRQARAYLDWYAEILAASGRGGRGGSGGSGGRARPDPAASSRDLADCTPAGDPGPAPLRRPPGHEPAAPRPGTPTAAPAAPGRPW